ncbi:hypothetical protein Aperf_G00000130353 [Anoplocephala perfoliata]
MSKSPTRYRRSSRHYDIVNGNSISVSKSVHRYAHDEVYSSHNHDRSKRRHSSRRTSEDGMHLFSKQRSKRDSNDRNRKHSYSKSPRSRHRSVNKNSSRSKEHSFSPSSSPSKFNRFNHKKSSESFSPLLSSPHSPNSSFGGSLFNAIQDQPKYSVTVAAEEVYTPEALYSLRLPSPLTFPSKLAVGVIGAGVGVVGEDEEEGVVPMDLDSSLSSCPHLDKDDKIVAVAGTSSVKPHRPSTPLPHSNQDEQLKPSALDDAAVPKEDNGQFSDRSSLTGPSAGIEVSRATKAHNERMRSKLVPAKRITLPPLHLHLSEDGTSPLPPGWQRAPNPAAADSGEDGGYPYYYYHTKTRLTRWDPPVYPWDADPEDNLIPDRPDNDPEAPYDWGCAHRYAVTHEEIEAMYAQYRSRMLERQCMEMIHEMGARLDAPQGAQEQSFAIELFSLIHNELRKFRDARVDLGRITNDEDLHYLTNKLAQEVVPKEIRNLHRAQQASASSLFAATPEVTPAIRERVTNYVRRYMESKGSHYRRAACHHNSHQHHQEAR